MRATFLRRSAAWSPLQSGRDVFTKLWSKPQTRDERVKEYVPEVLEESLIEQRKVLEESTSRDSIVEAGHRILREIENRSPTPSIAPHVNKILLEFGTKDLIGQRALSQLLYPTSQAPTTTGSVAIPPNELVIGFVENFKALIEHVEHNGRSAVQASPSASADDVASGKDGETVSMEGGTSSTSASGDKDKNHVVMAKAHEVEPLDFTLFVKVAAGMALSNVSSGDLNSAVRCCDAALKYAIDSKRIGGLYGMKAGILNRQKKYEEAAAASRLAIEASDNIQGYLHGAAALKALRRNEEAIALLEAGREAHPKHDVIAETLLEAKKKLKLSLPTATGGDATHQIEG